MNGQPSGPVSRSSIADTMQSTEGVLRQAGRDFLLHLYAGLRNLKMYPVENEQVQRSLDELSHNAAVVCCGLDLFEERRCNSAKGFVISEIFAKIGFGVLC